MRILLTGATGFIGRPLCRALVDKGDELVVLSRDVDKARRVLGVPATFHAWDGRSPAPAAAFDGVATVVPLAGEGVAERRWSPEQKRRILESRVLGVRGLLTTIEGLTRKPTALVAAAAIGLYGPRGDEALTESSPPGDGFLADVCKQWEAEIERAAAIGLREARIRVGVVLGEGGGALAKLIPIFRRGLGGPVGSGRQWMSWIHIDDIVGIFRRAIEDGRWHGPYNGVGPEPATNAELSRALGHALHRPSLLRAPAFALKLAMGEMASLVLDSQRVFPERARAAAFAFRYPTLGAALAEIGKRVAT